MFLRFLATIFVINVSNVLYSQQIKFASIDITDGLTNNRAISFAEDDKGFIWIGTNSGLNRYDGYGIKAYRYNRQDSSSLPDNLVEQIIKDQFGRLWISTPKGFCVFNPDMESFISEYQLNVNNQPLQLSLISQIVPVGDSLLLMYIPNSGIIMHNIYTNVSKIFEVHNEESLLDKGSIASYEVKNNKLYVIYIDGVLQVFDLLNFQLLETIFDVKKYFTVPEQYCSVFIDDSEGIWIYSNDTDMGVLLIDVNRKLKHFNKESHPGLNSNIILKIIQDDDHNYWIGTDHGGLNILNQAKTKVTYIQHDESDKKSLSQDVITDLFKSSDGAIWVGTFKKGVNYYHKSLFRFQHYMHNLKNEKSLPFNDVNCYAEDDKGNIWIGTNGMGLVYFDKKKNTFSNIEAKVGFPNALQSNVIVSLFYDKYKQLWVGTYHGGLSLYKDGKFTNYMHDQNNPNSIIDNRVWSIYEDNRGNLWVGTLNGGLELFDRKKKVFHHYSGGGVNAINSHFVMDITEDHDGNVWFATDNGAFVLDAVTSRFIQYSHEPKNMNSLSGNFVTNILNDSKNNIWVGTRDGLNLLDQDTHSFIRINTDNGLPDNAIMGILESDEDDIWVSTTGGLTRIRVEYDPLGKYVNHNTVNFNETDGLQGREFNEGSAFKTSKGELIFGGANGFNLFKPEFEEANKLELKTYIVGLSIFGKDVNKNSKFARQKGIEKSLLNNSEIKLSYNENMFSLQFVSLNLLVSRKIRYRYKLEGFNEQWIYTSNDDRKATFTNLNPGTYKFVVQSSFSNSDWNQSESSMLVNIRPPWYRTKLAYTLYYVFIVAIILLARRIVIMRERMKYLHEEAERESERQQELNILKTRFFTNVSHEFRTPLTLILTPLEKLLKSDIEPKTRKHLELMNQNAKRLLRLVNQLLDFRKAEANKLSLNLIYGNIIGFLNTIISSFTDYKESKIIKLEFLPDENELFMQFDRDKIEKIMMNLLSNAFKFTPEGGSIKVFTETKAIEDQDYLQIRVEDTGIGISKTHQQKIFERFYQNDLPNEFITKGSGIGLSLTSDFVALHGGAIKVDSTEGKGSIFTLQLPINSSSAIGTYDEELEPDSNLDLMDDFDVDPDLLDKTRKNILLVEDNTDFRFYLKDSLKDNYNILEAPNGNIALGILADEQVDLVVSDVMMPEMDGIELCYRIKTNADYSHIPIILLTAKSTQEDKLDGLKQGADEYITKPFNLDILEARLEYLLGMRKKFIQEYQQSFKVKVDDKRVTAIDKKMLDKAMDLINKNISNSEFSVEGMSKDLGMSRVYLYKKISALTGKTPIELIRLVRLKRAAELLMQGELNVSEVTYEVGFSDPKYFSKMFKAEFGVLPSKYNKTEGN